MPVSEIGKMAVYSSRPAKVFLSLNYFPKNSMTLLQSVILILFTTLASCQSSVEIVEINEFSENSDIKISAGSIGKITATTVFSAQAIEDAFPSYIISQKIHSSEAEMYPVILVSRDEEILLTITPSFDQVHIYAVIVENSQISPYRDYSIGMSYQQIQQDILSGYCTPGQEEWSGTVICPAKSASTIYYIFKGNLRGPDGELPPQVILNSWRLFKLIWSASNNKFQ